MTHRQRHGIEKLQVQATAIAALAATYFLAWPLVAGPDPSGTLTIVAGDALDRAGVLAAVMVLAAVACCLGTPTARPEGTMVAALLGLGGLSLRSGPVRELLAARQPHLEAVFWQMAGEVLLLAAVALAAAGAARIVRRVLAALFGGWAWCHLLDATDEPQQREYLKSLVEENGNGGSEASVGTFGGGFARIIVEHLGMKAAHAAGRRMPDAAVLTRCGLSFLLGTGITAGMVWLLARSADRGQVLFALLAGSFLGSLLACQLLPTRLSWAAWASPVAAALGFYVLAAVGSVRTGELAWTYVHPCYQAMPIDWITAGLGGSILGYWAGSRIHESRFLDYREQQEEGL